MRHHPLKCSFGVIPQVTGEGSKGQKGTGHNGRGQRAKGKRAKAVINTLVNMEKDKASNKHL